MQYADATPIHPGATNTAPASGRNKPGSEPQNHKLMQLLLACQQLVAVQDISEIVAQVLTHIKCLTSARHIAVWEREDDEENNFHCRNSPSHTVLAARAQKKITCDEPPVGLVTCDNSSLIVSRKVLAENDYGSLLAALNCSELLIVPLSVNNTIQAVLEIFCSETNSLVDDLHTIEVLVGSAAIALENAQRVADLKEQAVVLTNRNAELDAFAHTVAHDLRTPLNWVNGYVELLIKDWENISNDERLAYAHSAHRGARVMDNIINDLLLFASLGDDDIDFAPVEMESVLSNALSRLEPMLKEYGASMTTAEAFPTICGYGPWIEGIWVNYISNAIKYGGQTPCIEIGFSGEGEAVRFWVKDNGAGISAEKQHELFSPLSGDGRQNGRGHGLGLSIVRRIVTRLGGTVGVESEIGRGSCFSFSLPRHC